MDAVLSAKKRFLPVNVLTTVRILPLVPESKPLMAGRLAFQANQDGGFTGGRWECGLPDGPPALGDEIGQIRFLRRSIDDPPALAVRVNDRIEIFDFRHRSPRDDQTPA